MTNRLIISSLAQNELIESFAWYEEQTAGLGEYFAEIIYNNLNKISKAPHTYKKTKRNLREFVVDKFPFIIVYEYDDDTVNILHIFHTSRNPKLKYKR